MALTVSHKPILSSSLISIDRIRYFVKILKSGSNGAKDDFFWSRGFGRWLMFERSWV